MYNFWVFRVAPPDGEYPSEYYEEIRYEIINHHILRQGWGSPGYDISHGYKVFRDSVKRHELNISNERIDEIYAKLEPMMDIELGDYCIIPHTTLDVFGSPYKKYDFLVVRIRSEYNFSVYEPANDFGHCFCVEVLFSCSPDDNAYTKVISDKMRAYRGSIVPIKDAEVLKSLAVLIRAYHYDSIAFYRHKGVGITEDYKSYVRRIKGEYADGVGVVCRDNALKQNGISNIISAELAQVREFYSEYVSNKVPYLPEYEFMQFPRVILSPERVKDTCGGLGIEEVYTYVSELDDHRYKEPILRMLKRIIDGKNDNDNVAGTKAEINGMIEHLERACKEVAEDKCNSDQKFKQELQSIIEQWQEEMVLLGLFDIKHYQIILYYNSIADSVGSMYRNDERPEINLIYFMEAMRPPLNSSNISKANTQSFSESFLAAMGMTLAHEYFHAMHYLYTLRESRFAGRNIWDEDVWDEDIWDEDYDYYIYGRRISWTAVDIWNYKNECLAGGDMLYAYQKKQIVESLADFFSVVYALAQKSAEYNKVAGDRYDAWKRKFYSSWYYAKALCYLKDTPIYRVYRSDVIKFADDIVAGKIGRERFMNVLDASVHNHDDVYKILTR